MSGIIFTGVDHEYHNVMKYPIASEQASSLSRIEISQECLIYLMKEAKRVPIETFIIIYQCLHLHFIGLSVIYQVTENSYREADRADIELKHGSYVQLPLRCEIEATEAFNDQDDDRESY